jgi:choice-of-anchor C domain-containing protein
MVASLALAGSALAVNGFTNGGFETGTYSDSGPGFQTLNAPSTAIDGWTVTAGSVDWIGTYWQPQEPRMSLDLDGNAAGTITQTFATTANNTYVVQFWLSGNPDGGLGTKTLTVNATGGSTDSYSFVVTSTVSRENMGWLLQSAYTFVATSASTTLTFTSTTAGAYGPALDNVTVVETAATGASCKKGGWMTMHDSLGNMFKNQGDCVSFYATGGKNLGAIAP